MIIKLRKIYLLCFCFLQIQEVGLQPAYQQNDVIFKYLKKIMALPFLPHHEIPRQFYRLQTQANGRALQELYKYMDDQWIPSTIHEPKEWSVFGQPIRTNNDLEGWHHALNRRAGRSHLPFYELVELLHNEARVCELSIKLISSGKLKRIQKRKYQNLQRKVFD